MRHDLCIYRTVGLKQKFKKHKDNLLIIYLDIKIPIPYSQPPRILKPRDFFGSLWSITKFILRSGICPSTPSGYVTKLEHCGVITIIGTSK